MPGTVPAQPLGEPRGPSHARGNRPCVALAHDWLCGLRGGELVLDRILTALKPAAQIVGVYTMFADGRPLTPAIDDARKVVARLGQLPFASTRLRRWMLPLYPGMVAQLSARVGREHARAPIDLVISTSSAAIKGLRPPKGVPHLCYIHSPARYIWSQAKEYERGNPLRAWGLRQYRERFQRWDRASSASVTSFLANSTHTAHEVERCFGRRAEVLHPPIRTDYFTPDPGAAGPIRDGPWLVVSALEPYKRVDLAIHAANTRKHQLVVVGDGSERGGLERLAGPSVRFLGRVSKEKLRHHYRTSRMLLFPQVEDFGMSAVEALACGLPVVARRAGGALDILPSVDGASDLVSGVGQAPEPGHGCGAFFDEPTPEALLEAIDRCPDDRGVCRARAELFSADRFDAGLHRAVDALLGR